MAIERWRTNEPLFRSLNPHRLVACHLAEHTP